MSANRYAFYRNCYKNVQRSGLQGWGNSLLDLMIEKRVVRFPNMDILEVGVGSGEHFKFVSVEPRYRSYTGLDLNPGLSDPTLFETLTRNNSYTPRLNFVKGNAENMPFPDNSFDLVVATCVLAHVREPERVLIEMKRVVKIGGQIVIAMPTDPGITNRLIKRLFTYRQMKRYGVSNPPLEYAREHINGISNLLQFVKFHFAENDCKLYFFPLFFKSWNMNLAVIIDCRVSEEGKAT